MINKVKRHYLCPVVVVQLLSYVQLFVTSWTAAFQALLLFVISWSLLKLVSIKSVMPSNHLILCHPFLLPSIFPNIRSFPRSELFASVGQSIGVSASASVLPMNIQDWFPLGLTGLISLQSKGLSRVFSSTTIQTYQLILWLSAFFMVQLIHPYMTNRKTIALTMELSWQSNVSAF